MTVTISGDVDSLQMVLGFTLTDAINNGGVLETDGKKFSIASVDCEYNQNTEVPFNECVRVAYRPKLVYTIDFIVTKTKRGL